MIIHTVIPFFSDGIEVFENGVKSFEDYDEAFYYACNNIDNRRFTIVENKLKYKL